MKAAALRASAVQLEAAGTVNSAGKVGFARYDQFIFQLVVSAHAGTNETLDVTIEHSIDGGTTYHTLFAFNQSDGDANIKQLVTIIEGVDAPYVGDEFRCTGLVGSSAADGSMTYAVYAAAK